MPAPDYDERLLSEILITGGRGRWRVFARYDGQRYQFGTFLLFADAHRACSTSSLEKALGSPEKRAAHQVAEPEAHSSAV